MGWFATLIFRAVTQAVTWNMSDADKEQPSLWLATLMLLAPRRPVGLLVPYFLLAAGVALGLARALVLRLPRHLAAIPALAFGVLLPLPLPGPFSELEEWPAPYPHLHAGDLLLQAAGLSPEDVKSVPPMRSDHPCSPPPPGFGEAWRSGRAGAAGVEGGWSQGGVKHG